MKLQSLINHIEATDFLSFREVALLALRARGFEPELTDGPYDGGKDLVVYVRGLQRSRLAVQVSTERDWEKKLREELSKKRWMDYAAEGLRTLLFVSSRRVPEASFQTVADDLERETGVRVERLDAQGIASLVFERPESAAGLLRALGITAVTPGPQRPFNRRDHRTTLAFAVAFFGEEAEDFRRAMMERAIVNELCLAGGVAARETVVSRAAQSLGVTAAQRPTLAGVVDRLLQREVLRGPNGTITLAADELDRWRIARGVQERAEADLRAAVDATLAPSLPRPLERADAVSAVMENLGALLVDASASTSQRAVFLDATSDPRDRVRRLAATLAAAGVPDDTARDVVVPALVREAQASSFGRTLMAGELFLSLSTLQTQHLLQVLAEGSRFEVLLDTPIAMPLLCARLYEPTPQGFFVAADAVWQLLRAHRIPVRLPRHYLEEIASHLIDAARNFAALVEDAPDPDLVASENAFVAHFVALQHMGRAPQAEGVRTSFEVYLEGFEFERAAMHKDFRLLRDALMASLQRALHREGIEVIDLRPNTASVKTAQQDIAWALRELAISREGVVLDHDATTLAWAREQRADPTRVWALCTWDRVHLHLRRTGAHGLDVYEPSTLGDLLGLAAHGAEEAVATSPWIVAKLAAEEQARQGAAVWDALAASEQRALHDSLVRREARRFKDAWVGRSRTVNRARGLLDAWADWKTTHLGGA